MRAVPILRTLRPLQAPANHKSSHVLSLTHLQQHVRRTRWFSEVLIPTFRASLCPATKHRLSGAGDARGLCASGANGDEKGPDPRKDEPSTKQKGADGNDTQSTAESVAQQALNFSRKFDPEGSKPQKLPSGMLGNLRIHWVANISMFERAWVGMAIGLINRGLDPTFKLDGIMDDAITAYRVVRQISSNAKTKDDLSLLSPFVAPDLIEVLQDNLEGASATEHNTGLHVHDVCGEVVDVKLRMEAGEIAPATDSLDAQRERGTELLQKAQWLQLKIRFVALETDFVRNAGGEKHEIATSLRPSTWTLEGRVWQLLDPHADESVSPIENSLRCGVGRKRHPELAWQLTSVSL